jgi:hypothetical protein
VAEDKGGPLPRRVPGTKRGPGTGPLTRPVLSESDLQRIRAALDSAHVQASAPPAERPAPLPRRVPGVGNRSEPPVLIGRLELPAALLPIRPEETPTETLPAVPAPTRPGDAAEETELQPDFTAQPGPAAAPAGPSLVPAQRAPAPPETPPPPPKPAPPKPAPPTAPASSPVPAGLRTRRRGRAIITGSAIATLVLLSAGSAFLLTQHAGPAKARPDASAEVAARDRAADWVASQVGRADLISCDQAMCRALQTRGVPADDLVVLKPGRTGRLGSAVVVVTAAARKIVGSRRLAADAPAAIASFGSGAGRVVIGVVFPRGAGAYATALRKEIADRKTAGSSLLLLGPVTATAVAREELQGGQADSRLVLTLAELASQWPVTIMAFGDRGPGASPGIPFRSADLVVTDSKAGPAPARQVRIMSDFVHQLGGFFASARIGTVRLASGQETVRIEFKAPGRFGLLGTSAR